MARPPVILVENHPDRGYYPGHNLVASSEAPGFPVQRLTDGRRDETRCRANAANVEWLVTWDCAVVRLASALFLERGHNLGGKAWLLEGSSDNFATTPETVVNMAAHPTVPGGRLEEALGAVALDGSWGILYAPKAFRWWRIRVPAVSAYTPELTGIHSGRHFQLLKSVPMPYADYDSARFTTELESVAGRIGRSRTYRRRQGSLVIRAGSEAEYADNFKPWFEDGYRDGPLPAWFVLDPDVPAETTMNVICPNGATFAFAQDEGAWPFPTATVPFIENTPELT